MLAEHENFYRGLTARDKRFDGIFYVGVTSTNIYCRPICSARTPKRSNCRFFKSAAQAEVSGFRPCLKCRPELAPGLAPIDSTKRLAKQAFLIIQENGGEENLSTNDIARELGISTRHLRRILQTEYGVSPIEIAKTQKLLTAKRLLTDTTVSLTEIAYASGFQSVRSFNHQFKKHYGFTPSSLRLQNTKEFVDQIKLKLAYRPPIAWQELLSFLKLRAIDGVEQVLDNQYVRTVKIGKLTGWIKVHKEKDHLILESASELLPCLTTIVNRVNNLFDLEANPLLIEKHLKTDPFIEEALKKHPGMRVPGSFNQYEACIRAIAGQLVSVKSASTITSRLVEEFGQEVKTPFASLDRVTPTPAMVAKLEPGQITKCGFTKTKADSIISLAKLFESGKANLNSTFSSDEFIESLLSIKGIGPWTANYLDMRVLRNPDAFPAGDLVLKQVLNCDSPKEVESIAKIWQPWRAYAAMYLWSMKNNV